MIGSTMIEYLPRCRTLYGWSDQSKVMGDLDQRRKEGVAGSAA
jgi:hypothetical protein